MPHCLGAEVSVGTGAEVSHDTLAPVLCWCRTVWVPKCLVSPRSPAPFYLIWNSVIHSPSSVIRDPRYWMVSNCYCCSFIIHTVHEQLTLHNSLQLSFQGANWSGIELARVLLADLLQGVNWPRSEKARYCIYHILKDYNSSNFLH